MQQKTPKPLGFVGYNVEGITLNFPAPYLEIFGEIELAEVGCEKVFNVTSIIFKNPRGSSKKLPP